MRRKWAVFGRLNEFLMDIQAESEAEALAKAKLDHPHADKVVLVCPGNDLGVSGVN